MGNVLKDCKVLLKDALLLPPIIALDLLGGQIARSNAAPPRDRVKPG